MTIESGKPVLAKDFKDLTFFPKGTVLMYDGTGWEDDATIKGWYKCAGQTTPYGNTPNLIW